MIDGDESGNHEHHSISHPVSHRWSLRVAPPGGKLFIYYYAEHYTEKYQPFFYAISVLCPAIRKQNRDSLTGSLIRFSFHKFAWNGKLYQTKSGNNAVGALACRPGTRTERERERGGPIH